MSMVKIGTLLLVSAVVACVLFVVVVLATPTPEPDAPFNFWQVLGTLLLIYWLGAAVAGAILLLVNLFSSGGLSFSDIWPPSRWAVGSQPADADRAVGNRSDPRPARRSGTRDNAMGASARLNTTDAATGHPGRPGSVRASVFCSSCGTQNSRGQRLCDSCESPLPG